MSKKVRSLRIEPAANGHTVTTDFEPSDSKDGMSYEPGEQHVFTDGQEMMAHVGSQLGVGQAAEPDADDEKTKSTVKSYNDKRGKGRQANEEKTRGYAKEMHSRKPKK